MINWQLSKQGIHWPPCIHCTTWPYRGLKYRPIEVEYFLKLSADKLPVSNDRRLKFIFSSDSYEICCVYVNSPALLRSLILNWTRTRKFSQSFKNTCGEYLFLPSSRVGQALHPIFMLWLVKIWQVSSWGKFMQHLETCLLWQLKLTEFCVNLWCFELSSSSGCTKWITAVIKSLLLFMAGLFIGFSVEKCVACQNMVIRFRMASFRFSPRLMRILKRV